MTDSHQDSTTEEGIDLELVELENSRDKSPQAKCGGCGCKFETSEEADK